jgi:hypothetical protein
MANQSKKNDPRFWKKWKESGAVGTIYGPDVGEAYAFFDCNATMAQITQEIPTIRNLVSTPRRLKLYLTERTLSVISPHSLDHELLEIALEALDAKRANIRYVLAARSLPNMTNRQTADELATILNQAYQSPLYQEGEEFRGEIVFEERGRYIFRE